MACLLPKSFSHNSFISYHVPHNAYLEPLPNKCLFPRGYCSYLTIFDYETEKNPSWFLVYFLTRKEIHLFEWTNKNALFVHPYIANNNWEEEGKHILFFLSFAGNLYH